MIPGCRIAIVADDLTGALDAAAPFARRGASTRVVVAVDYLRDALAAWADDVPEVVAVNTESRHLSAAQAEARVVEAIDALQAIEPRLLFKKIDSTLRGHVVTECLAARRASRRYLLAAPSVPAQGRMVLGGQVFVHGRPLADSSFATDARSAPPRGTLNALFAAQGLDVAVMPAASGACFTRRDWVADAERDADLNALASCLLDAPGHWLAVGAGGLASALARLCFADSARQGIERFDRVLLVVGSRSPQAQQQITCLREAFPELPVKHALKATEPVLPDTTSALLIPGSSLPATAEQVATGMADAVAGVIESEPGDNPLLFLTGGDTAMAVMHRLGVRHVEVASEWASGVAYGWLDGDRRQPVMTKAGGFGDSALLARLVSETTTRG